MRKRILFFIFAFIICITSVLSSSLIAYATETDEDGWYYDSTYFVWMPPDGYVDTKDEQIIFLKKNRKYDLLCIKDVFFCMYTFAKVNIFDPSIELGESVYDFLMSNIANIAVKLEDFDYLSLLQYDPMLNSYFAYHDGIQYLSSIMCESYTDGKYNIDENGYYSYGAFSYVITTYKRSGLKELKIEINNSVFNTVYPVAFYLKDNQPNLGVNMYEYNGIEVVAGAHTGDCSGYHIYKINDGLITEGAYLMGSVSTGYPAYYEFDYSIPIPIYNDYISLDTALRTGDFSSALNYRPEVIEFFEENPIEENITVPSNVLIGFSDKVAEINSMDKTPTEKYALLWDYINEQTEEEETETETESEEESESESETETDSETETESESESEEESESAPITGSDDSEDNDPTTHSWLKKIYEILEKIYDKIKSIRRWVIVDTIVDGADLVTDLLSDVGDIVVNLIKNTGSAFSSGLELVESLGDALSVKFPFCIPWDIAFLFNLLKAEPKTPEFILPLKIETYGIDEELVLSLEEFEIVSKISRTFFTLIFCHGLLNLTFKIVDMKEKEYQNS